MIRRFFHAWERQLASVTKDRVIRPFEWGLEWIPVNGDQPGGLNGAPPAALTRWSSRALAESDAFFAAPPTNDYRLQATDFGDGTQALTFPSAIDTPHRENNTVVCRYFPARGRGRSKAAVLVMPQWNADAGGHVGLCRLLAMSGMSALRLSLPYHDRRMPPELNRADYIVSSNVARTVQVCRQAVVDARRAVAWLAMQGYERIGILGTSLGSCLALLTTAHEPRIRVQALNHISPHFADVVWRGLSTRHVREGLDGHIDLETLRELWAPISPWWYLERLRSRQTLLVYAKYDLTFPVDLSRELVQRFERLGIPHEVAVLPCGHYSTGKAPFKFLDGWLLIRYLRSALAAT